MRPPTAPLPAIALLVLLPAFTPLRATEPAADPAEISPESTTGARATIWWHRPAIVEALELDDGQRETMDEYLRSFEETVRSFGGREAVARERGALRDALAERQWDDARIAHRQVAALHQGPIDAYLDLRIAVYSLLEAEQWTTLQSRYRTILEQPWGLRGLRDQAGSGGREGRGRWDELRERRRRSRGLPEERTTPEESGGGGP